MSSKRGFDPKLTYIESFHTPTSNPKDITFPNPLSHVYCESVIVETHPPNAPNFIE